MFFSDHSITHTFPVAYYGKNDLIFRIGFILINKRITVVSVKLQGVQKENSKFPWKAAFKVDTCLSLYHLCMASPNLKLYNLIFFLVISNSIRFEFQLKNNNYT